MGILCCRPENIDFDTDVSLFHFTLLKVVGRGAFGKVRVVQHKQTRELYALKYINKVKCVKMKAVANVIQERRLLEEISHPYIVNLRYAFQDDENCILVIDLMLGGDLRFHLERVKSLSETIVRFYMAQISSAVSYLHQNNIIHRDIKPDNILLDSEGNVHLTDFNIAVHIPEKRLLNGVAGSMAYMAPEILSKRGYSYQVDWWSVGVCAYELLFGIRPFRGKGHQDLSQAISKEPLAFPSNYEQICSEEGVNAVCGWLTRDNTKRLGCGSSSMKAMDIRSHPWFMDIDWTKIDDKTAVPPFVPDNHRANFDASHELEELLLEDNPLRAKARKIKDPETLTVEMRQMEEQFEIFDFRKMSRRQTVGAENEVLLTEAQIPSTPE